MPGTTFDYDTAMWDIFAEGVRIVDQMRALQQSVLELLHMIEHYVRIDGDVRDIRATNAQLLAAQKELEELREEFLEHVRALRVYEDILF
jgi:hypothetical protein